jgi:hypothetical protein
MASFLFFYFTPYLYTIHLFFPITFQRSWLVQPPPMMKMHFHGSRVEDAPPWLTALLSKLQAILLGSRDPALADDPGLVYGDAVELQLLLERLSA